MRIEVDIVILGSGFGGSIAALVLDRIGLRVALIDRGSHPRFAIGESTTPMANAVLRDLAAKYRLPRLEPLSRYGTWQRAYPYLACGVKRGFSYFKNSPELPFIPRADHANELLVAASSDSFHANTHWLRAGIDEFLAEEARTAGICFLDHCDLTPQQTPRGWRLTGHRWQQEIEVEARFVIDGSGEGGVLCKALGIRNDAHGLQTHSRTIFAHFTNLGLWHEQLEAEGHSVHDHPFGCDDAVLHHVLDEGWMWVIPFNNGVTSAGFVLESAAHPLDSNVSIEEEWNTLLRRYPSIAQQFERARIVDPPGGLRRTRQLQRWAEQVAGDNWAMLPSTAGFIDPLHSTGIAHTLCGIERLTAILAEHWGQPSLAESLQTYHESVRREIAHIDQIVSGCFATRRNFALFTVCTMMYFLGATNHEHRRHQRPGEFRGELLSADDPDFRQLCTWVSSEAKRLALTGSPQEIDQFVQSVAMAARPFNRVGLFHPEIPNMYRHTAAPL